MNSFTRIVSSYTTWNLLALLFLGNKFFLTANTVFIAVVTSLFVAMVGLPSVTAYFNSFGFGITFSHFDALLIHIVAHYAPLLYTGTLYDRKQVFHSLVMFGGWLLIIRGNLQSIYVKNISLRAYFMMIGVSFGIVFLLSTK